jgi:hypothetical protein
LTTPIEIHFLGVRTYLELPRVAGGDLNPAHGALNGTGGFLLLSHCRYLFLEYLEFLKAFRVLCDLRVFGILGVLAVEGRGTGGMPGPINTHSNGHH